MNVYTLYKKKRKIDINMLINGLIMTDFFRYKLPEIIESRL